MLTGQLLKVLRGEVPQAADVEGTIAFGRLLAYLAQTLPEQLLRFYGAGDDLLLARYPQLARVQRRSRVEDEAR